MPKFWFHHCATISARDPSGPGGIERRARPLDDDDSGGGGGGDGGRNPRPRGPEVSISLNGFGSGPMALLWEGVPRAFLAFCHAIGIYKRDNCVCCESSSRGGGDGRLSRSRGGTHGR